MSFPKKVPSFLKRTGMPPKKNKMTTKPYKGLKKHEYVGGPNDSRQCTGDGGPGGPGGAGEGGGLTGGSVFLNVPMKYKTTYAPLPRRWDTGRKICYLRRSHSGPLGDSRRKSNRKFSRKFFSKSRSLSQGVTGRMYRKIRIYRQRPRRRRLSEKVVVILLRGFPYSHTPD